jgi:PAS domain S-box-containing protein
MNEYEEKFSQIIDLLEQHVTTGLTVTAVARELAIPRNSASKYLELLSASGDVSVERFGQKKFYRPLPRIPLPEIFDRLPNALVILDANLKVRMMNASFVTQFRIRPGRNIIGIPLFDLDLPVFAEPAVRRNIERIGQSQMYIAEMQLIEERTDTIYRVDFAPIVTQIGKPGIMVSLRDITAGRKAETALKDSEKKIATLFETVPSGIVMFSADGMILNANHAALENFGLQNFEELSAGSAFDLSCAPGKLESLIRNCRPDETELACDFNRMKQERGIPSTKSGVAYFNVVFTPIRPDSGGPPTEFAIIFKDITRDRRERKELSFREIRYHSFFEDSCNGVIIYEQIDRGTDHVFKDLNRTAEELLQMPKADLIGRNPTEVFPDLDFSALQESVMRVMTTGKPEFLPPIQYRRGGTNGSGTTSSSSPRTNSPPHDRRL